MEVSADKRFHQVSEVDREKMEANLVKFISDMSNSVIRLVKIKT